MSVIVPSVKIKLDRERTIRFNKAALNRYFQAAKRKPTDGFSIETLDDACAFLYAGLSTEDPALTLEQIDEWMDPFVYSDTIKAFVEYMKMARSARATQEAEAAGTESPLAESSNGN